MSASQISLPKRLLSGVAVAMLALALAACSDEKQEAASTAPTETTATPDTTTTASTAAKPAALSEAKPAAEVAQASTPAAKVELPTPEGTVDAAKLLEPGALPEMALGEASAPVTIVEYMSMTCPHCANFHNDTFDAIKTKYVDSGKVRFIVREFPFDPRAAAAFMLARCAPEGQYFPMISMLFKQQEQWAAAQNGRDALLQLSKLAGFTQESFEACLTNQKLLDDVNAVMQRGAKEFGVKSTPTFFVNGAHYSGDMSVDVMSALIDSKL
ncbi:DsbA family protein [Sinorhizobium medicae]|uniref:DSBA oxidoreductase n=1 Tax=Sinorhizobium medicae TaxID=110321 RepID=A0A508XA08_9HYPH|nr:DsbA family protein [Sinorhizobium medicae]MDX0423365.1 thioredoxin domain-containing protein [Sinorhizobium medicae]MDX0521411.1 thioredoxin domain-containing protein [Sinorhizobium medicae]MDX0545723.1 thioredoxin domain-containing protein [Sinorhizobium medicae]MDX0633229.1 thioredoxin domain-containing protein [Sinorhizobium medicae]MDX0713572.1 thioredoxin domain-containing protein [Sinorhizobium medicae]